MAEPTTLLSRLLSRRQRRRPFSDMMGPNPLDSQAVMDAAQGADVSTPGGMTRRSAPADSGSMILASASGGGGGGTPVTTAAGSGASAPVQTTAGGRFFQRSGGGCANGQCGIPQSTYMVDDGGFPVTTMTSPTVVSAPTTTGMPGTTEQIFGDYDLGNVGRSRAGERERAAAAAERAFGQTMEETRRVNTFNMEQEKKAAAIAKQEAESRIATQTVVTTGALEGTTTGQYDLIKKAKEGYLLQGGSVRDLANAIASLRGTPPIEIDSNGNPVQGGPPVVTEDMFKLAFSEALGLEAVRGFVGSQYLNHELRADPAGQAEYLQAIVPRRPEEADEDYALRQEAAKKDLFADQVGRSVEKIVGAMQDTPEWKQKNQNSIRQRLVSDIEPWLSDGIRRRLAELNPDANPDYLESQAIEYTQRYMDLFISGTLASLTDPNHDPKKTWSVNETMSGRSTYWGGDKTQSEPPPADSNDTMPDIPFVFPGSVLQ